MPLFAPCRSTVSSLCVMVVTLTRTTSLHSAGRGLFYRRSALLNGYRNAGGRVKGIVLSLASDEKMPISHARFVTEWWAERAPGLSPAGMVALFDLALSALWRRARRTLGEVTLGAIVERVLATSSELHPLLAGVRYDHGRISSEELRRHATELSEEALRTAFSAVLADWLTVIGNLTAEILTPALRATLSEIPRGEKP